MSDACRPTKETGSAPRFLYPLDRPLPAKPVVQHITFARLHPVSSSRRTCNRGKAPGEAVWRIVCVHASLQDRRMHVSIIGTHHEERGAVTVSALLAILKRIQPDVVFAEIPQTHFGAWRDGSHGTVESIAVARYADIHSIDVVPVDSPTPDDTFFQRWEEATRAIERTSPEFRRLVDLNADRMGSGGFAYLNSDECIRAWTQVHREELDTIEYIGSSRLRDIYVEVRGVNERRDLEMLRNIHTYCASTVQARGTFLVGAEHRKSLIEKLRAADEAIPQIDWDVSGSHTGPGKADAGVWVTDGRVKRSRGC